MLYLYAYLEITYWQKVDAFNDYRKNVNWIRKNGVYKGYDDSQRNK